MKQEKDDKLLSDALSGLYYLTLDDTFNHRISFVLQHGSCRRIIELLQHPYLNVQSTALQLTGNLISGDDSHTLLLLQCNLLDICHKLLFCPNKEISLLACWSFSNLCASSQEIIDEIMKANIFNDPKFLKLFKDADLKRQKEICWAIANVLTNGSNEHCKLLFDQGWLSPFYQMLSCPADPSILNIVMEG